MHTVFALLCFVVVIHWLIIPYPSGLLHWHCGNLTISPVPAKQPWWIWINTSCEFIMNDCITTTKQSTTKPCAYFLGYTGHPNCCFIFTSLLCIWLHSVVPNFGISVLWRTRNIMSLSFAFLTPHIWGLYHFASISVRNAGTFSPLSCLGIDSVQCVRSVRYFSLGLWF